MEIRRYFRKLNLRETESDPPDGDGTNNLSKHPNFDYVMTSFDKTTVEFLQKFIFI